MSKDPSSLCKTDLQVVDWSEWGRKARPGMTLLNIEGVKVPNTTVF